MKGVRMTKVRHTQKGLRGGSPFEMLLDPSTSRLQRYAQDDEHVCRQDDEGAKVKMTL